MRDANRRKNIFKLSGEVTRIETVETPQENVEVPVSVPKLNVSKVRTAKKISRKYNKLRRDKAIKLAQIKSKEIVEQPKPFSKSAIITAKKISNK